MLDYEVGGSDASYVNDLVDLTNAASTITFGASAILNLTRVAGATLQRPKNFVLFQYTGEDPVLPPTWTIDYGNTGWWGGRVVLDIGSVPKRVILVALQPQGGTTLIVR